ncbi:MAG: hypothetical protein HYY40_14075 [Bacteroidetes bacterium]|nr:hypothetical protein [Bacteroidota bacterium]
MGSKTFFKRIIVPILAGLVVAVVTTLLATDYSAPNYWCDFFSWRTCALISLTILTINIFFELLISKKDFYIAVEELNKILNLTNKTLRNYALNKVRENSTEINSDINSLMNRGLPNQPLREKLEIVTSIIKDSSDKINKYFSTSCDLPSKLYNRHYDFFQDQEKYLKNVKDKRRIVIIGEDELEKEIKENGDILLNFLDWHCKNNFRLRFLINRNSEFEKQCHNKISNQKENEVLTDFAIIGNDWVYGEVTSKRGGGDKAALLQKIKTQVDETTYSGIIKEFQVGDQGYLKILQKKHHDINTIKEYEDLYETLWEEWSVEKWAMMSLEQVRLDIVINKYKKSPHNSDNKTHYKNLQIEETNPKCYNSIIKIISEASNNIYAVDIVTLKLGIEEWLKNKDYIDWMNATIQGANKAISHRIYVLKEPVFDLLTQQNLLSKVFKNQQANKVKIYLTNGKELIKKNIPIYDFCLVDNKLCFGLEWKEIFSPNTVSIDKNLLHPDLFDRMENTFNQVKKSNFTQAIANKTDEQILHFLQTLEWK